MFIVHFEIFHKTQICNILPVGFISTLLPPGDPATIPLLNLLLLILNFNYFRTESGFHGKLTRVQVWQRALDASTEIPRQVRSCRSAAILFDGLILRWSGMFFLRQHFKCFVIDFWPFFQKYRPFCQLLTKFCTFGNILPFWRKVLNSSKKRMKKFCPSL